MKPSLSEPAGTHPTPPPWRWLLPLATAAGLCVLLDDKWQTGVQLAMFALGALLNSRWLAIWRWLKALYLVGSLPVFLWLADPYLLQDELWGVRLLYYVLLGTLYTLPFVAFRSAKDLRRAGLFLAASFFIAGIYLQSSYFLLALWLAASALVVGFLTLEEAPTKLRLRVALGHLSVAAAAGFAVFLLFPRAWFGVPTPNEKKTATEQSKQANANQSPSAEVGMSSRRDILQLASLIDFRRGNTEVLSVKLSTLPAGTPFTPVRSMYLRAATFETYSGGNWHSWPSFQTLYDEDDMDWDGWVQLGPPQGNGLKLRQQIQAQTLEDMCFSLPNPVAVKFPKIRYDSQGVLSLPYRFEGQVYYEIISEIATSMDNPGLDHAPPLTRGTNWASYLEVPLELRSLIAKQVASWDLRGSPATRARQLCARLQSEFGYGAVSFESLGGMDPVEAFLTQSKQGYCTHFATTLALMVRTIGLPARVASGFHFNGVPDASNAYRIYEYNAHAWTEIYFPQYGWVIFDATPPALRPSTERVSKEFDWRRWLAKLQRINDLVSDYSAADQQSITKSFKTALKVAAAWWGPRLRAPMLWGGLAGFAALAWWGVKRLPLRQRRRLQELFSGRKAASEVPFYADLLWLMEKHGLPKAANRTGQEFLAESRIQLLAMPGIDGLTQLFYRVKYGGHPLTAAEILAVEQQLQTLERQLQNRR